MRKLLRSMTKAEMRKKGYAKINRLMSEGRVQAVLVGCDRIAARAGCGKCWVCTLASWERSDSAPTPGRKSSPTLPVLAATPGKGESGDPMVTAFRILLFIVMILSWLGHVADNSGSKGNSYVFLFGLSGALMLASFPICGT